MKGSWESNQRAKARAFACAWTYSVVVVVVYGVLLQLARPHTTGNCSQLCRVIHTSTVVVWLAESCSTHTHIRIMIVGAGQREIEREKEQNRVYNSRTNAILYPAGASYLQQHTTRGISETIDDNLRHLTQAHYIPMDIDVRIQFVLADATIYYHIHTLWGHLH